MRRRGYVPLRRLDDVPLRRRWVFHLRRTCDVTGTYRETQLRRRHNVLLPYGALYDHTLHRERKHFCRYCLQAFSAEEILKSHIKEYFKINGKQKTKEGEFVKFKNYERKVNSSIMIYANFEIISVPENNGKRTPEESYANKYQKHIACTYEYKLICIDDKFSKPFKTYLDEYVVYNFINSMIDESKYCSDVMKKN